MKTKAQQTRPSAIAGPLIDRVAELDTLEDLYSSPSLAKLGLSGESLCDSQGNSILRIGQQL